MDMEASCAADHGVAELATTEQLNWTELNWTVPDPGIKSVSPALANGFFTAEPSGKPCLHI